MVHAKRFDFVVCPRAVCERASEREREVYIGRERERDKENISWPVHGTFARERERKRERERERERAIEREERELDRSLSLSQSALSP